MSIEKWVYCSNIAPTWYEEIMYSIHHRNRPYPFIAFSLYCGQLKDKTWVRLNPWFLDHRNESNTDCIELSFSYIQQRDK